MLEAEEASAAGLCVLALTVATVTVVNSLDEHFVDTNSIFWCMYAGCAIIAYCFTMIMAITTNAVMSYLVCLFSVLGLFCLVVWLAQRSRRGTHHLVGTMKESLVDTAEPESPPKGENTQSQSASEADEEADVDGSSKLE